MVQMVPIAAGDESGAVEAVRRERAGGLRRPAPAGRSRRAAG